MRVRGSRSNARGDRRLHLLLSPRLFARAADGGSSCQSDLHSWPWCGKRVKCCAIEYGWARIQYPQAPGAPKRDPQISLPTARFDLASTC
jgi:hypothetical protein